MGQIIIINGPPGVGKTTVSRCLSALRAGTACIEGDRLRAFAPDNPRQYLGGGSTYRAGSALSRAYLQMGATRVLFDYIFLRPSQVHHFREPLGEVKVFLFTLWADLGLILDRAAGRVGREPLGSAISECYAEIEENRGHLGRFLSVAQRTPNAVADEMNRLTLGGSGALPT